MLQTCAPSARSARRAAAAAPGEVGHLGQRVFRVGGIVVALEGLRCY